MTRVVMGRDGVCPMDAREKFAEQLHEPVVLHPKDVKTDKGVLYLPLYMAQLLVSSCHDSL